MSRRTTGTLAAIALVVSGFAALSTSVAPSAGAASGDVIPYCSAPAAAPCLVSFSHDGSPVNPAVYRLVWQEEQPGAGFYNWYVQKFVSGTWRNDMGDDESAHVFTTELDFGTFNPRTFGALGSPEGDLPVTWDSTTKGHHRITVTASPTYLLWSCFYDPPSASTATCPHTAAANDEIHGELFGVVNNGNWIGTTEAEHETSQGTYNFRNTNIGEATPSPQTDPAGNTVLVFNLQNAHENAAHETFLGEQHVRLPNDVVRAEFGVPDPETMVSASLVTTVIGGTSGTVSIHPESTHEAMLIDITGVTFSTRKVVVKVGHINPTAPTHLKSWRISSGKGRIYFVKSYARGAKPTGYYARCANGSTIKTVKGTSAGITFTNLAAGKPYACRVRSSSKAGYSAWSDLVRFAARP